MVDKKDSGSPFPQKKLEDDNKVIEKDNEKLESDNKDESPSFYKPRQERLFFHYADEGDYKAIAFMAGDGSLLDINYQNESGMTILHYAAMSDNRPLIRYLVRLGKCDYLIKDNMGRYASELAFEIAQDYAVGILLAKKEAKQAREQGIRAWPKNQK
jgi:ankyrin repeat protein